MANSVTNHERRENAAIRRQFHHLVLFAALLFSALIVAMVASFAGILPNWVATASSLAAVPVVWFFSGRAISLHRRGNTPPAN